jgi:hypothetical protein
MADLGYHIVKRDPLGSDLALEDGKELSKRAEVDASIITVSHKDEQSVYASTERILKQLAGRRVVTVGECLGDPVENWYRS